MGSLNSWLPLAFFVFLVLFDMQNLAIYLKRKLPIGANPSSDFTILVPIFGHSKYLANLWYLERYKANTVIVLNTTTPELQQFASELEGQDWRVHHTAFAGKISPADMLKAGLGAVQTTYALRMDGDSYTKDDLALAVGAMEDSGKDLCSVRVLPSRRKTLAEKMQGVEYDVAMQGRRLRPWFTSGACILGRTEALRHIMNHHSQWFFGEDIEVGMVAKHFRMKVGHIDMPVYTDVPETFRALAKQRRGWWAGHFRHSIINMEHLLHYPVDMAYRLVLIYLLLATKWWEGLAHYWLLPIIMFLYIFITLLANWPVRSRWMALFPPYALCQTLFFPVLGMFYFFQVRRQTGRPARFKIRLRRQRWQPKTA
ncbi:MAG TPA: glycosyltransferase family 2 protein [Candidatus Dormibacteraeota bacterium]|nr:glycosyltransferase family 2 protein [Candidatus Dormibacteraeota bacterium]